jgi:type IX secretion system PorP/SprF family membrane protein
MVQNGIAQQRSQFTQYMFTNLIINPAYAGVDEALSLTFIQRKQWAGVEKAPSTQTFSGHTQFIKKHMGLGLVAIHDQIGVHKNIHASMNGAYHLQTGKKSFLSMGMQVGIHHQRSDYASIAGSTYDPKVSNNVISYSALDLGAGFYFRSPKFHAGLSAPDLVPERVNVNDTLSIRLSKMNLFIYSRYIFKISETLDGEPSVLIKYLSGVPYSFDLNMNVNYRKVLTCGFSYRNRESVDFLLKAQVTPQLQFGYAYDHPIGKIAVLSNESHELMVQYLFRYIEKKVSSPR